MVSNLDRIYREICRESKRLAAEHDLQPDQLTELIMEIVDVQDQHSFSPTNVNKQIETLIRNFAGQMDSREDSEVGTQREAGGDYTMEDDE
jgi:hypothetical protein